MFDMDTIKNIGMFFDRLCVWKKPMADKKYKANKSKPKWWKRNRKKKEK